MTTLLAWNCRGLGRALAIQSLKELVRSNAPMVIFLSEMKQPKYRVDALGKSLKYNKGETIDPSLTSAGGITLWWRPCVEVQFLDRKPNYFDTIITFVDNRKSFRVIWFYAPPYPMEKRLFWESMTRLPGPFNIPLLGFGDFNDLLCNNGKEGGIPLSWNHKSYLAEFMNQFGLMDLGYSGQDYTWENCREDSTQLIKERLDRAITNPEWLVEWPMSSLSSWLQDRVGSLPSNSVHGG